MLPTNRIPRTPVPPPTRGQRIGVGAFSAVVGALLGWIFSAGAGTPVVPGVVVGAVLLFALGARFGMSALHLLLDFWP